jgi:hypothetical protein
VNGHRRLETIARRGGLCGFLALGASLLACSPPGRFPLREAVVKDPDLHPISIPCRADPTPKEPKHISCAPPEYVSPLAWDAAHNSVFRPLSHFFKADPGGEAVNANALDEVADSSWFTNRLGARDYPLEEWQRGACSPEVILDGESAKDGTWVIDHGKDNGSSPGFRVKIPGKGKYLFKADSAQQPERPSAGSVMGAAAYHAVGFNTSCEQVVYFKKSVLKLTPGLKVTNNTGVTKAFDDKALEKVFKECATKGDLIRMQASAWLPGKLIGPFRYEGTRKDDPNDKIQHEDRRELRAARILAAWIDHFDSREQNSMDSWIAVDKKKEESSPGFVRHYYLDTSDCFGSEWDWDEVSRRLGHSYLLDVGDISTDFITLGVIQHPWDVAHREPNRKKFGYYTPRNFDASTWKNEYPNPAFSRMTERDGAWMARKLAYVTPTMVRALAEMGKFSDPGDTDYIAQVMMGRLWQLQWRYLTRLSPIASVELKDDKVCGIDLARMRGVAPANEFRYSAMLHGPNDATGRPLSVEAGPEGKICVALPHLAAADVQPTAGATAPYVILTLRNRAGTGPLEVHLYDLGPHQGYRIAGIDRPEP